MTSKSAYIHVVHGDISRIQADVLAYSTSFWHDCSGETYAALAANVPGFKRTYTSSEARFHDRRAYWLPITPTDDEAPDAAPKRPVQGVVVCMTVSPLRRANHEDVRQVAAEALRVAAEHATGARLIIAFPALGAGNARGKQPSRLAEAQIRGAADALREWCADACDEHVSIDVVMVAYDRASLLRFLAARRKVRRGPDWPCAPRPMDEAIGELARRVRHQECVLFVGSGLSSGAGLPSWTELTARLLAELPEDTQRHYYVEGSSELRPLSFDDYLDIASWHRLACKHARDGSIRSHKDHIRDLFSTRGAGHIPPTLAHYLLMSMPWRHIVTTNYDTLIERTLDAQRVPARLVTTDREIAQVKSNTSTSVIKFHGHAANTADDQGSGDGIVLTRGEYENFFDNHPAKALLIEGLLLNHNFLFYGYSISDQDLKLIYNRVGTMLDDGRRRAFSVAPETYHALQVRYWEEKHLHLVDFGDAAFDVRLTHLLRWLDSLLEAATSGREPFLADRAAPSGERADFAELHQSSHALGAHVVALVNSIAAGDGLRARWVLDVAEPLLDALHALGWRPERPDTWTGLWSTLAREVEIDERVRLLLKARATATNSDQVRTVTQALEEAERALADQHPS